MNSAVRSERLSLTTTTDRVRTLAQHARRVAGRHVFKLCTLVLAAVAWTGAPYHLIGLVNRRTGFLHSVFYCYPGDARYARHYCYAWCDRWFKWLPAPIGFFRQGGKWGLIVASPVSETEFTDMANDARFRLLLRRIERIAAIVGAAEINRAGVLPSIMYRRFGIETARLSRTVDVVCDAIDITRTTALGAAEVPVILLGGGGYIGRALHRRLKDAGCDVHVVDPAVGSKTLPTALRDSACLLVDVARRGVLAQYADQLWSGMAILNETFPEPPRELQHLLARRGIGVYHLAGTPARVWPSLPHGYSDCVPCCALHETGAATAIVRKLA